MSEYQSLEAEREAVRGTSVAAIADAIQAIGFECTRCGACCTAHEAPDGSAEPHTATIQPEEARDIAASEDVDFRDVARPIPYGLSEGPDGPTGETFEWSLQTDACGDCTFYEESDGRGSCTVHDDRPLICETYPFSLAVGGGGQPMGDVVDQSGPVQAHECEGLGRDVDDEAARSLAEALKERALRDLTAAIAIRDGYDPVDLDDVDAAVVVHDHEGAKGADGRPLDEGGDAGNSDESTSE